jgi:dUTP pyrophosphatase
MKIPTFRFALREDLKGDNRFLPMKGEPNATGYDIRAAQTDRQPIVLQPGDYFKIPVGLRVIPERGWWFEVHPRSSSFIKKHIQAHIGIIDSDFSDQLHFLGKYSPTDNTPLTIAFGESIAQIIPVERQEMNILDISNEEYEDICKKRNAVRKGGFGSTDELPKAIDELSITTRYIDPYESPEE